MYWQDETPVILDTGKNVLKYYPKAEKLQVCMPCWTNGAGEEKQGKTVALNLTALLESGAETIDAAGDIFADILKRIDKRLEERNG